MMDSHRRSRTDYVWGGEPGTLFRANFLMSLAGTRERRNFTLAARRKTAVHIFVLASAANRVLLQPPGGFFNKICSLSGLASMLGWMMTDTYDIDAKWDANLNGDAL
jgi:hypothetical protein